MAGTSQISLNGKPYTVSDTRTFQAAGSIWAPRINQGGSDSSVDGGRSTVAWGGASGGIGLNTRRSSESPDKVWFSKLNLDHDDALSLPPKIRDFEAPENTSNCSLLVVFKGSLYGIFNNSLYRRANLSGDWGDSLADLEGTISSNYNHVSINEKIFIPYGSKMIRIDDNGITTLDISKDVEGTVTSLTVTHSVEYAGNIYALTDDNELVIYTDGADYWQITSGTLNSVPHALLVALNASGTPALYVTTANGALVYDPENTEWVDIGLNFPPDSSNGLNAVSWNGILYYPVSDGSIISYQAGQNALINVVGPDRPDGYDLTNVPSIRGFCQDWRWLYLLIYFAPTGATGTVVNFGARLGGTMGHRTTVFKRGITEKARIYKGTRSGAWSVVYSGDNHSNADFSACSIGKVGNQYGLFFYQNSHQVGFIELYQGIFNPNLAPSQEVVASQDQEHLYATTDAGDLSLRKNATELFIEYELPENCQITLELDITDRDTPGIFTYPVAVLTDTFSGYRSFKLGSGGRGIKFDTIRPKLTLRSDDETKTPIVRTVEISFRRKLEERFGFQFFIPTGKSSQAESANKILAELTALNRQLELVELKIGDKEYLVYVSEARPAIVPDSRGQNTQAIVVTVQED